MKEVHTRVLTPRSPDDVYGYLVDFENQAEWLDVLSSELVSGDPGDRREIPAAGEAGLEGPDQ